MVTNNSILKNNQAFSFKNYDDDFLVYADS